MDVYIAEFPDELTYGFYGVAVAAAFWRGGGAERTVGALTAWQAINGFIPGLRWTLGVPTDVVTFVACMALVLRGRRYWTVWAAAAALLFLVMDALRLAPGLSYWSYSSAKLAWSYVLTGALLFGSLTTPQRVRESQAA